MTVVGAGLVVVVTGVVGATVAVVVVTTGLVVVAGTVVVGVALPQPAIRNVSTNRIARGIINFFTFTSLILVSKNGSSQNHSQIPDLRVLKFRYFS